MAIRPVPATREEWLKLRAPYVGASEVSALLGMQADYQLSPFALFHVKAGTIEAPDVEGERIEWGNDFEDAIARVACRKESWCLQPGVFATDDDCPGSSATLDRVVMPTPEDVANGFTGPGALEVKNVDFIAYRDKWLGDEPPAWILLQLQDQLACTGWQWGAVTACIGGNEYYVRRYKRYDGIIAAIRKAKTEFWTMVKAGTPPKPDHYESTGIAMRRLYPKLNAGSTIDLRQDNELPELWDRATDLAAKRKQIEKDEEAVKNIVRGKLGANERALLADGRVISRSVGDDTPDRPAKPGEVIKGRKGADRLYFSKPKGKAA